MKTLTILLPDTVNQLVLAEAKRRNVDAATLCSSTVAEHFLEQTKPQVVPNIKRQVPRTVPSDNYSGGSNGFDVGRSFPNYPGLSIELAQQFVDESLRMPGTRAFKAFSGRGVGIEPNFVFIEYLRKRQPGGIGVSFYGSPGSLQRPSLLPGRNPNYSRSIACTQEELSPLLEVIRRSYQLKFARTT
jgi:hypothetical protein